MESIWVSSGALPRYAALRGDIQTDVLVIGGGMAGILCAYTLQREGISCVLVEADRLAGGITQNTTAKLTSQHGFIYHRLIEKFGKEVAARYLRANEDALAQYRALCQQIDCDYSVQNNYIYSRCDPEVPEKELRALSQIGGKGSFIKELPLPFPTAGAVMFKNQAQFHPLKFLSKVTEGLRIYESSPVRQLKGQTAITDHGCIRAEKIIIATHFPFLNKHGSYFMKLYQQRSYVIALEGIRPPEGMYLDEKENKANPDKYKQYEAANGWGTVEGTKRFYETCLNNASDWISCNEDLLPVAVIWVS